MSPKQKNAIRQIESNLYEKLISLKVGSIEYKETRSNWLTAHYAVQYFAKDAVICEEHYHAATASNIRLEQDLAELIRALGFLLRAARTEPGMEIYGAHMDAAQLALDNACNVR